MRIHLASLLAGACLAGTPAAIQAHDNPASARLDYRTPSGMTYHVTPDGLTEVRLGDRTIARGNWQFQNESKRWRLPELPQCGPIKTKTLEVVSPTECRVIHSHSNAAVRYTYQFRGDDVRIDAYVENLDRRDAIYVAGFAGLEIDFGRTPQGLLPNWHSTYTEAQGLAAMHPGILRLGGAFAVGDGFGIGAVSHDSGIHSLALLWDWDWDPKLRAADRNRRPRVNVYAPIPALGARTFSMTFRFSTNTDWKYLYDVYRQHLYAVQGSTLRYDKSNNFPLIQCGADAPEEHRSPTNPYCYWPDRRLDTLNGILGLHARVSPTMRAIQAQGMVIWGQSGNHPRGAMYRSDFDAMPPETTALFPRLSGLFRDQRMRLGVATRPNQSVQPLNWTKDTVSAVDVTRVEDLELLVSRFANMAAMGCDLFYLDSFGNLLTDTTIIRAIRDGIGKQKGIGPKPQTYAEQPTDLMLPYTGFFITIIGSAADGKFSTSIDGWLEPNAPPSPSPVELLRYLYPDAQMVGMLGQVTGADSDERIQKAVEFCLKKRITPLLPDIWIGGNTKIGQWLPLLSLQYQTGDGQWR